MSVERANPGEPRRRVDDAHEFMFDVLVDGRPARRKVSVVCAESAIHVGDDQVDLDTVFWVSRRAGLVLLFTHAQTYAFHGRSGDVEELARTVERGSDRAAQRSLLQPLAAEVVVCTAGTAASGEIDGASVTGLHLAVFTQRALHLFARNRKHTLPWPVDRVSEINTAPDEPGRAGLRLSAATAMLTLRYLFPEEIQAVARVARRSPSPVQQDGSIEMFGQAEVTPPPAADLPEFTASAETLKAACQAAADRVRIDRSIASRFDRAYFERHFQELGEIALGPLILRRSAAAGAASLEQAVEAMDAEQLRQDTIAAFHGAADQLFEVYGGEVEALLSEKRLSREHGVSARAAEQRTKLAGILAAQMESLDPAFGKVLARQHLLLQRLQAREHAPPETDETGVEEATREWKAQIETLDHAYGSAWSHVLGQIADLWSERFLPRLRDLSAKPSRRLSETARLAILATVTFVVVGALALWLF
ncbi:MAG: hypothetical protein MJB57_16450 [Gemmatimonadetes bacterium]|nr:hypothetical protein [Gemmatimonadota bacterium]